MRVGIIIYGLDGNFDIANKTWDFINHFDSDVVFSIGQGITTEAITMEKFPNSKFNRDMSLEGSNSERCVRLLKKGYTLLNGQYDTIIIIKINSYIIADNGFDFLLNCNEDDRIYAYRPIKIIGKQLFYVPDYFFIGSHKNMDTMINNLPDTIDTDINDVIPKTLLKNELYIQDIGPFFYIEEVFNNIVNSYMNLTPYELKIKAEEWKKRN
jgi:hypothetical protein